MMFCSAHETFAVLSKKVWIMEADLTVREHTYQIAHSSGRDEQCCLLSKHGCHMILELGHRRIGSKNIIVHLRICHCHSHCRRWLRDRIRAEIHHLRRCVRRMPVSIREIWDGSSFSFFLICHYRSGGRGIHAQTAIEYVGVRLGTVYYIVNCRLQNRLLYFLYTGRGCIADWSQRSPDLKCWD